MRDIDVTGDALVEALLRISEIESVCILDSCGVGHLGSHLMIAGVRPVDVIEFSGDAEEVLRLVDETLASRLAGVFTLSYDLGRKLQLGTPVVESDEPDIYFAVFDALVVHDYDSGKTYLTGDIRSFDEIQALLAVALSVPPPPTSETTSQAVSSNFSRGEYIDAVERIREHIRSGDTYQTNLTQQIKCKLADGLEPQTIFSSLRKNHPAPFAAFLKRENSTVVSASPERFFRTRRDRTIEASPIKGTRPRGATPDEDVRLRDELKSSEKDRAENTMIVDLVRNDLGRVCEFGSVRVDELCAVEEHPTLFHLVSTVRGQLRRDAKFSDILRAVFPCGSITGAPKIRTMQIIDEIERVRRGLSMGAIGIYLPPSWDVGDAVLDMSVAIRTMVVRDGIATFNVGGGVVIDSEPKKEYDEAMLKASALLTAIGAHLLEQS